MVTHVPDNHRSPILIYTSGFQNLGSIIPGDNTARRISRDTETEVCRNASDSMMILAPDRARPPEIGYQPPATQGCTTGLHRSSDHFAIICPSLDRLLLAHQWIMSFNVAALHGWNSVQRASTTYRPAGAWRTSRPSACQPRRQATPEPSVHNLRAT